MEAVEETPGDKGGGVTLWAGEGEAPKTRAATPSATPPPHPHPPPPGQELADFHPTFHNGLHGRLQGGPQELASTSASGASLTRIIVIVITPHTHRLAHHRFQYQQG